MRIAIFHNYLDNIGGAERVVLTLARELQADVYSPVANPVAVRKLGFDINVRTLGWLPANAPFRQQLALLRFRQLDLSKHYDFFIIAGDWAVSAAVLNKPNLWYVHSPIREIWDLYPYTRQKTVPFFLRWPFDAWVHGNRFLTRRYIAHVQRLACNSLNTQQRIRTYLGKEAVVIYPPIETKMFRYERNGDYWLSVNRLISHKNVDLQIRAFRQMPDEKLMIVGCYEKSFHFQSYARYIRRIAPPNVKIVSWLDFIRLTDLYANCKGFLTTALDEDFGMTAVEAMASGKAVIAPAQGGYRETVIDRVTGRLIDDIDEAKIIAAVKEIGEGPERYREACQRQAQKFDTRIFIEKIKTLIGYQDSEKQHTACHQV